MKNGLKILACGMLLCLSIPTFAQENDPGMADTLRSEGKIWVVVAVIGVIFLGISLYLFLLDRRITKMENDSRNQ